MSLGEQAAHAVLVNSFWRKVVECTRLGYLILLSMAGSLCAA